MGRAPCCEKVGLKKGRWTAEEDEKLANYIKANGEGSWRSLPKNAGLLRCGKSCRLRWINYLRADLKRGNISAEEEEAIIKLHSSLGNRWSLIAAHLPGRTDNEIKNYWNSHLSRRIHSFRRIGGDGAPVIMDLGRIVGMGRKRRGGRTSRSAAKKKNAVDAPIASDRYNRVGAGLPSHQGQSEPANCGGTSMVTAVQPACGLPQCERAGDPSITFFGHEEQLGSNELLDLWETSEEMGSDLFRPSGEMGDGFLVVSEESPCWGSPEEMESGGWSAVCSPSYEGELGATMSRSSTGEERDGTPTPASSGLKEVVAAGVVEGVEAAAGANLGQPSGERGEYSSSAAEGWVDMELVEMAAWLWDETGEAWQCHWEDAGNSELELPQFCMENGTYEDGALDGWFLSDFL